MIPELLAISALRVAVAGCTDTTACSLAGACVSGACVCDQGFKGDDCSVLDLKPAQGNSRALYRPTASSWGGSVLAVNGSFYMYTAVMLNDCGLDAWQCNSACGVATSKAVEGPYTLVDTGPVVGAFCHNPTAHRAPDGTFLIYHIGTGLPHDKVPPMHCHSGNGSTDVPPADVCTRPAHGPMLSWTEGAFQHGSIAPGDAVAPPNIAHAGSPLGPFVPLGDPATSSAWGMNNPAVLFLPNGSLIVVAKFSCNASVTGNSTFCRQFGVFSGVTWRGPYRFVQMIDVFGEDPYLFRTQHGIHLIADLRRYTPAAGPALAGGAIHHAFSSDGLGWTISTKSSAIEGDCGDIPVAGGSKVAHYTRRERPQILHAEGAEPGEPGRPLALFNGAAMGQTHTAGGDQTLTVVQPFATTLAHGPIAQTPRPARFP